MNVKCESEGVRGVERGEGETGRGKRRKGETTRRCVFPLSSFGPSLVWSLSLFWPLGVALVVCILMVSLWEPDLDLISDQEGRCRSHSPVPVQEGQGR